jgi:prolyl oligopeptidase
LYPVAPHRSIAGHGVGKPTSKIIEETADQWAFLVKSLGMNLPF